MEENSSRSLASGIFSRDNSKTQTQYLTKSTPPYEFNFQLNVALFGGQSWNQKLGESRLLVPGQLLSAPIPNYITLDRESGELSWHTASEWIPEDGLYDHLVLNVDKG